MGIIVVSRPELGGQASGGAQESTCKIAKLLIKI